MPDAEPVLPRTHFHTSMLSSHLLRLPLPRGQAVRILSLVSVAFVLFAASSCKTLRTKRIAFDQHPIAARVTSEIVDEETLRYRVVFRNTGTEVISFGYTIGDEPGVVHIDTEGPNSGLVENLYPGAEVEVDNPFDEIAVWITLGRVVYGKQPSQQITQIFRPSAAGSDGGGGETADDSGLPTL